MAVAAQHGIGHEGAERGRLARAGGADHRDMHGFVFAGEGNAGEGDAAGCPRPETPEPPETECPDLGAANVARPPRHSGQPRADRAAEEGEDRGHHHRRRPTDALEVTVEQIADAATTEPAKRRVEQRPGGSLADPLDDGNGDNAGQYGKRKPERIAMQREPRPAPAEPGLECVAMYPMLANEIGKGKLALDRDQRSHERPAGEDRG